MLGKNEEVEEKSWGEVPRQKVGEAMSPDEGRRCHGATRKLRRRAGRMAEAEAWPGTLHRDVAPSSQTLSPSGKVLRAKAAVSFHWKSFHSLETPSSSDARAAAWLGGHHRESGFLRLFWPQETSQVPLCYFIPESGM